jgi:nicotinate-nucleotide adenylyltransferase
MTRENTNRPSPLAFLGGTFDPVHYGHLRCADDARRKLGLDVLYLLPSGTPPHRDSPQTGIGERLDMLRLACVEFPGLVIDERETRRQGPSYMVDTLRDLRGEFPDSPLMLLVGQDAANHLHSWYQWLELFELAHIIILTRPGSQAEYSLQLQAQVKQRRTADLSILTGTAAGRVYFMKVTAIDISASKICKLLQRGESPRFLLPTAVLEYIEDNALYTQK